MTVKELADLRARLNAVGASFTVVKNTLARRAAGETGREGLLPYLEGPSGLVWTSGDPVVAAKALAETARTVGDRISVKGGVMGDADLPRETVLALAALPPREALVAQLAAGVAAPLTGLAGALGNLISGLARALAAVQAQRAEAPAA
jgi:large subunit ribosomal protein L10